eukprot:723423-Prorocentrum_minimum.AAC.1
MGLSHSGWTAELRCATSGAVLSLAAGAQMDCDWLALADMASPAGGSRRPGPKQKIVSSRTLAHERKEFGDYFTNLRKMALILWLRWVDVSDRTDEEPPPADDDEE